MIGAAGAGGVACRDPIRQIRSACCIETHDGLYYSWDDLDRATAKLANLLASLQLPEGARVAVQLEKSP